MCMSSTRLLSILQVVKCAKRAECRVHNNKKTITLDYWEYPHHHLVRLRFSVYRVSLTSARRALYRTRRYILVHFRSICHQRTHLFCILQVVNSVKEIHVHVDGPEPQQAQLPPRKRRYPELPRHLHQLLVRQSTIVKQKEWQIKVSARLQLPPRKRR
jgi:hypothetical protein